jgi:hypothetical protein
MTWRALPISPDLKGPVRRRVHPHAQTPRLPRVVVAPDVRDCARLPGTDGQCSPRRMPFNKRGGSNAFDSRNLASSIYQSLPAPPPPAAPRASPRRVTARAYGLMDIARHVLSLESKAAYRMWRALSI